MNEGDKREFGQHGVVNETGVTAITGSFVAIHILADTVFALLTDTDATGDVMTGFTITAGQILYGQFTAFTLTSGKVRAYVRG